MLMRHVDAEIISLLFMLTIMIDVFKKGATIFAKLSPMEEAAELLRNSYSASSSQRS